MNCFEISKYIQTGNIPVVYVKDDNTGFAMALLSPCEYEKIIRSMFQRGIGAICEYQINEAINDQLENDIFLPF